ncbi:MAG TPA: hypothetical protein VFG38_13810 [Pseudomonadales bacterium]|nr:hypothetical protein [Pseudomonadales bacterium]
MPSMAGLLVVLIIATACYLWVKRTRAARDRWIARLSLPGVWQCESPGGRWVLEFVGEPTAGRYTEQSGRATERGRWRLLGNEIQLETDAGTRTYQLRLFDNGSIGIDGPGRERRIYVRQRSNVVPLRKRQ